MNRALFFLVLTNVLLIALIPLLYQFPLVNEGVVAIRPWIAPMSVIVAMWLGVFLLVARALPARVREYGALCEAKLSIAAKYVGVPLIFLLSIISVWAAWSQSAPAWQSDYSAVLGHLPWSDAASFAAGPFYLGYEGHIDGWSARRPINVCLAVVRHWLGGFDFDSVAVQQTFIFALSLSLATAALFRFFGVAAALGFFGMVLGFTSEYLPTTLSESLGISLGLLSFTLLLSGFITARAWCYLLGLFAFGVTMCARAGPYFVVPFLILLVPFYFGRGVRQKVVLSGIAFVVGLSGCFWNSVLWHLYSNGQGQVNDNLAPTLLALVLGADGWLAASTRFNAELASIPQPEHVNFFYAKTVEAFRAHPEIFFNSVKIGLTRFINEAPQAFQNCFKFPHMESWAGLLDATKWVAILLFPISMFLSRNRRLFWFFLACVAGIFVSSPLIWPDGNLRVFAGTIPVAALLLLFGVAQPYRMESADSAVSTLAVRGSAALFVLLLVTTLLSPIVIPSLLPRPVLSETLLGARNTTALLQGNSFSSNAIRVMGEKSDYATRTLSIAAFREGVTKSGMDDKNTLLTLEPPFVIAYGYDIANIRNFLFVASPEILKAPPGDFIELDFEKILESRWTVRVKEWRVAAR